QPENQPSRGPESAPPTKPETPVTKEKAATNDTRPARGAETSARLKIAGVIAPQAMASKKADTQMNLRSPVSPARIQLAGSIAPARNVPMASTALLPLASATRPHRTVEPSEVRAAIELQVATCVKVMPSSSRK